MAKILCIRTATRLSTLMIALGAVLAVSALPAEAEVVGLMSPYDLAEGIDLTDWTVYQLKAPSGP